MSVATPHLCAALVLVGCAGDERSDLSRAVVTDSAGIRIVHNATSAWTSETAWQIDSMPLTRIGERQHPDSLLLSRAWDLARLTTGALVVLHFSKQELLRFSPDGTLIGVMGRMGTGPGEFERSRRHAGGCGGDIR